MTRLSPSRDIPRLETWPWGFWACLTLGWPLLWFYLWAALRGILASLAVAYGSLMDLRWLPFLLPGLLLLGIGSAAWMAHRLRHGRNPPLPAMALLVLLLTGFAPGAFYMVTMLNRLTPYELTRSADSLFYQNLLTGPVPDALALLACLLLGGIANGAAMRLKYPGMFPTFPAGVAGAWLLGGLIGWVIGFFWGTIFGILFAAGAGNAFTIHACRKRIADKLASERQA